jgi:TetR/AcrR family transcriptional regulator
MNYIAERRLEEKEARRKQIVDAAEEVYADTGWDDLTIDQVARKARLSRALVYVYFKDKFDLHCAICERGLQLLGDRFEHTATLHVRGRDQVEALGRAYVSFSQELPHYFQALARFEAHAPTHVESESNEAACMVAGNRVHSIMVACIETGIKDGSVRSDLGNPFLTAVTLWGFMHGTIQIASTKANMLAADGLSAQQMIDHALRMSSLGLSPKES